MSAKKPSNPFLKKASGAKPPTRAAIKSQQKHGGLGHMGRGLDALIPPAAPAAPEKVSNPFASQPVPGPADAPETERVLHVPTMDIERSPYQPRTEFSAEKLQELADSLRANGIIQPLTCRRRADGKLELICGERRLRAAQIAGIKLVPVTLRNVNDDIQNVFKLTGFISLFNFE